MKLRWDLWLYGLMSAFIGGGAGAITTGGGAAMIDPDHFNLTHGLRNMLMLMGFSFLGAALPAGAAYLKEHPLPAWDGEIDRRGNVKPPNAP